MSGVTTEQKTTTASKDGKTIKTETTIETTTEPTGKVIKKTTVVETTTNQDGSTSTQTKVSTETSFKSSNDKGYTTEEEKKKMKKEKKKQEKEEKKEEKKREKRNKKAAENLEKYDKEFLKRTNEYRKKFGKEPLRLVESMCNLAKEHNDLMISGQRPLGHDGFQQRTQSIHNATAIAENVCCSEDKTDPIAVLFGSLINDPPHRENILGPYNAIGLSVGKNDSGKWFATQLFAFIE